MQKAIGVIYTIADHVFFTPEIIYPIIIMAPQPSLQKWKIKKRLLQLIQYKLQVDLFTCR